MPIRRFGQHDAGDERTERGREAQIFHQRGAGADRKQPRDHEQLTLRYAPDQREHRVQHEFARRDQDGDADDRIDNQLKPLRCASFDRRTRQGGHDGQQRHDRQILKQQDGKALLPEFGLQATLGLQQRQHLRGGTEAQRQTDDQRRLPGEPHDPQDQCKQGQAAHDDLRRSKCKDIAPHPPQTAGRQLQPDEEQQQDDADFGKAQDQIRIADQTQHLRADQHAADQIAQHRA